MTQNIIVEAINVEVEIEGSFSGSLSTSKLISHFSSISTASECMDNFTSYCHAQRGWKRKVDIGKGKSKVACGWQALQTWSSMILLSEVALWSEELSVTERNELVKKHWLMFKNAVAKKCFRNSVVFNNMASMRAKPTKNVSGQTELSDLPEESAQDVVEAEKRSEQVITLTDRLLSVSDRLKAIKDVSEVELLVADLEAIIASLS
jgi:hypothetical protein